MTSTQEPTAATAQPETTKEVLVNVVLDRSGSMSSCKTSTISGYNEYLKGLKADTESNYSVTLIQFDSPGQSPELTVSYTDKPLGDVPELSKKTYEPRGMTPLYDAIGECIRRVEAKSRAVFTVIITDGMENASTEFTQESIRKLIKEKEAEGWKFVFLGANIDSAAVGGSMGIAVGDCADYSPAHAMSMFASVSTSNLRYAAASRSYGVGTAQAMCASNFTEEEREANMGGRPAEPPTFHTTSTPIPTPPAKHKPRTKWSVRG